jgi:trigger factor
MATVKRENIGELHDKLVVTITKEDYMPSFENTLKKYGKTASIPGFRKGNVPAGLIRKMHGQSVFIDEVLRTANKELEQYLTDNKPEIFAQPLPLDNGPLDLDMNKAADFDFAFEIGLKPEFDITPLNKRGAITKYKIKVSDEMLEKETENLRKRSGKVEDKESLDNDSDIAFIDIEASNAEGDVADGIEKTQGDFTLGQLPKKFAEQLKGKKAGDTLVFKPSEIVTEEKMPDFMKNVLHQPEEDKAAQEGYYKLTLKKAGTLVPRELNEEFFNEIFPNAEVKDEAAFKAKLKEELEKETERIASEQLQNTLFETLVHETPMKLPVDFLKNWMKRSGEKEKADEEVEAEFPDFDHQLRWTLISDKLVKDLGLEVSMDEVMKDIKTKVMGYFGMKEGDDAPWLEAYLDKMAKEEKTMDETYRRLLFDKLFKKLEEVMEVKDKEVNEEEFTQVAQAHHHHH